MDKIANVIGIIGCLLFIAMGLLNSTLVGIRDELRRLTPPK